MFAVPWRRASAQQAFGLARRGVRRGLDRDPKAVAKSNSQQATVAASKMGVFLAVRSSLFCRMILFTFIRRAPLLLVVVHEIGVHRFAFVLQHMKTSTPLHTPSGAYRTATARHGCSCLHRYRKIAPTTGHPRWKKTLMDQAQEYTPSQLCDPSTPSTGAHLAPRVIFQVQAPTVLHGLSISLQKLFIHENNACLPLCVTKTRKCTAVLKFFFFSTKNGGNFVAEANPPFAVKGASPTYPSFANNVE